jgi:predicted RNA binding protein YcfA (HicA-like mRNA interferase family)
LKRDLARLLRDAEERGWTVHRTRGGHVRLKHPGGGLVVASSTPSDWREVRNTVARMARAERTMQETR